MKKTLPIFVVGFVLVLMYSLAPTSTTAQAQINATEGTPTLDGIASPGEWTSNSITTTRGVTIKSMVDDDNFYVLATWPDTAPSVISNQWTFDGTTWTQTGNDDEDRVMFIWDMGESGADIDNGCFAFCHFAEGNMFTNNPGDRVDVWHWKAARFNPIGFTDDKYWDDVGRQSDDGSGSGASNAGAPPAFMAATDPGANVTFLAEDQAARNAFDPFRVQPGSVDVKTVFNAAGFTAGDRIPGRILAVPSGNRASVQTAGSWFGGTWTVEFRRKIAGETGTDGNTQDFTVPRGGSVKFANEIFDNVTNHANHFAEAGGSGPADTTTAYTINFPVATTVLVAHFINGNTDAFRSRVYLWNPSASAANITVRVYTMPRPAPSDPPEASQLLGTLLLGTVEAQSSRAIRIEEVLSELLIPVPYITNGGNLTFEFSIEASGATGSAQVFSSDLSLAFGTYPLQVVE